MTLKFKPENEQVRIVFSGSPERTSVVTDNPMKIFATIGPFENHDDKIELQRALAMLLRGWNVETK